MVRAGRHVSNVPIPDLTPPLNGFIGIQHNSGATEAWVWAIDNVMLLLHPGVV
jgi:hypothetical protein